MLGILWALISPAILAIVFWLVFGVFLKISTGPIPYLLLVFAKLTFWNFFSQSVSASAASITGNSNLITKSYFPREIVIFSPITVRLVDLGASLIVLIILMVFYGVGFSLNALWVFPLLILEIFLISSLTLLFSSLNVYFRDITAFLPLLMTSWLFATPIVYNLDSVPQDYQKILLLNPMTGIIEGIKQSLLLKSPPFFGKNFFTNLIRISY